MGFLGMVKIARFFKGLNSFILCTFILPAFHQSVIFFESLELNGY
ncbi:MAG: hypothetical protein ACQEQO_00635 [Thermodesulfobacteriota bacterium]